MSLREKLRLFVGYQVGEFVPIVGVIKECDRLLKAMGISNETIFNACDAHISGLRAHIIDLLSDTSLMPGAVEGHISYTIQKVNSMLFLVKDKSSTSGYNLLREFLFRCLTNFWYFAWGCPFTSTFARYLDDDVAAEYLRIRTYFYTDVDNAKYISIFSGVTFVISDKKDQSESGKEMPLVWGYPIRIVKKMEENSTDLFTATVNNLYEQKHESLFGMPSRNFDSYTKFNDAAKAFGDNLNEENSVSNYTYKNDSINGVVPPTNEILQIVPSLLSFAVPNFSSLSKSSIIGTTYSVYRLADGNINVFLTGLSQKYKDIIKPTEHATASGYIKEYNKLYFRSDKNDDEWMSDISNVKFINDKEWKYFSTIVKDDNKKRFVTTVPDKKMHMLILNSLVDQNQYFNIQPLEDRPTPSTDLDLEPEITSGTTDGPSSVEVPRTTGTEEEEEGGEPLIKTKKIPKKKPELEEGEEDPSRKIVSKPPSPRDPKRKSSKKGKKSDETPAKAEKKKKLSVEEFEKKRWSESDIDDLLKPLNRDGVKVKNLQTVVEQYRKEVSDLRSNEKLGSDYQKRITGLLAEINDLKGNLAAKDTLLKNASTESTEELSSKVNEHIKKLDEIKRTQLEEHTKEVYELRVQIREKEEKIKGLESDLRRSKQNINTERTGGEDVENLQETNDSLLDELDENYNELENIKKAMKDKRDEYEGLLKDLDKMKTEVEELKKKREELGTVGTITVTNENAQQTITDLSAQVKVLENYVKRLTEKVQIYDKFAPDASILEHIKNNWAIGKSNLFPVPKPTIDIVNEYRQFHMLLTEKALIDSTATIFFCLSWIQHMSDVKISSNRDNSIVILQVPLKLVGFNNIIASKGLLSSEVIAKERHLKKIISTAVVKDATDIFGTSISKTNADILTSNVKAKLSAVRSIMVASSQINTVEKKPKKIAIESEDQFLYINLGLDSNTESGDKVPQLLKKPGVKYNIYSDSEENLPVSEDLTKPVSDLVFDSNIKRVVEDGHSKIDIINAKVLGLDRSSTADIGKYTFNVNSTTVGLRSDSMDQKKLQNLVSESFLLESYKQTSKPVLREHGFALISEYEIRSILKNFGLFGISDTYQISREDIVVQTKADDQPIEMWYNLVLNLKNA